MMLLSEGMAEPGAGKRIAAALAAVITMSCGADVFVILRIGCPEPSAPATVHSTSVRLYQERIAPVLRSIRTSRPPGPGPWPVNASDVPQAPPPLMYCQKRVVSICLTVPFEVSRSQRPTIPAGPLGCAVRYTPSAS